jgi:hypothetical protein
VEAHEKKISSNSVGAVIVLTDHNLFIVIGVSQISEWDSAFHLQSGPTFPRNHSIQDVSCVL